MLVEVLGVDRVELSELSVHVSQENVGLDNVLERGVGSIQNVGDVLDHLLSLFSNGWVAWQRLVLWSVRNLARNIDETWALVNQRRKEEKYIDRNFQSETEISSTLRLFKFSSKSISNCSDKIRTTNKMN